MGIEDRFNCCQANFQDSLKFMDFCFQRGYKPHLDQPCSIVKEALKLAEGLFLAINLVFVPKIVLSFDGFLKYWYQTLNVTYEVKLNTMTDKLSFYNFKFCWNWLLRCRLFYNILTLVGFKLLRNTFANFKTFRPKIDAKYGHIEFIMPFNNNEAYSITNRLYKSNV